MLKKILTLVLTAAFLLTASANVEARSLWADNTWGMFADKKARDVGDILTIIISESTTQTATKSRANSKSGSTSLGAGTGIFHFLAAASASGSDSFQANGSATDTNRFSGRITVTVVEVLPNDNMIVEGTQSIWQNRDEHKITLRGIVRRADVTSSNTVPSTKVADATVKFDGKGPLNAKQRQGILTQIFNFLF
ncbi:MAG: flagellar basal body L-ring protein FlgH [Selenomonadaceae bacterium]|nr:flagellar basal body L-ring protein FlgH [Selenomonadaceae bacterium]